MTALIVGALPLTQAKLAAILQAQPEAVPVVAAAANFSQERLKTWLKARFGTTGWITLARERPDELAAALVSLGLPFTPRGRFEGSAGRSAPVDFAIPEQGAETLIAVAVKGFDSTGSKLTDARREIEEMATVRRPRQFIYAIVDGHGWLRRESDLRRIHELWRSGEIDGLYDRVTLGAFTESLRGAATRLGLL